MPMARLAFHGTSIAFTETIREHGLVPPPGHGGVGVRVRFDLDEAMDDARSYAAWILAKEEGRIEPKGIIVAFTVPEDWLREDAGGVIRAVHGIPAQSLQIRGPHDFTSEFFSGLGEPREALWDALERWEILTGNALDVPRPKQRARRS